MLKALYDRLEFALIGFVLGAIVAVVLWFLYGVGFSPRSGHMAHQTHASSISDALVWVKYIGGLFALIGFFCKASVGDALGQTVSDVHGYETHQNFTITGWVIVVFVLLVVLVVFV